MNTYTFFCVGQNQVATIVDVQALAADGVRRHALGLLREHSSVASVEVWQDEGVIALVERDGMRPSLSPAQSVSQTIPID